VNVAYDPLAEVCVLYLGSILLSFSVLHCSVKNLRKE